jgi:hypothetical protein
MGQAYPEMIADRFELLMQLQSYAAAGDPEIRRHVARSFRALCDDIVSMTGATPRKLAEFLASGMLANVTTILELPDICEPLWENPGGSGVADPPADAASGVPPRPGCG